MPVKHLAFAWLLLSSLPLLMVIPLKRFATQLSWLGGIFFVLLTHTLLAFHHGFNKSSVLMELSAIMIFTLSFYFMLLAQAILSAKVLLQKVLVVALVGNLLFLLFKALLFSLLLFKVMSYQQIQSTIFVWINYEPVGLALETGGSRLSFVTLDFLSLVLFILYWNYRNLMPSWMQSRGFVLLLSVFFLLSLYAAYSRALFLIFPALLLALILVKRQYKLLALIAVLAGLVVFALQDVLWQILQQRFFGQEHSDNWRYLMIQDIWRYFAQAPVFGWGIGAYLPEFIRDLERPYSYEVQFLSMFFKFGILYPLFVFALGLIMLLKANDANKKLALLIFIVWMSLSFTNQYLFNTTTAVVGLLIYLIFQQESQSHALH